MHDTIELTRTDDGRLVDPIGDIVTCSWFLMCVLPATDVIEHPILGGVPICGRCADKVEATS